MPSMQSSVISASWLLNTDEPKAIIGYEDGAVVYDVPSFLIMFHSLRSIRVWRIDHDGPEISVNVGDRM